MRKIWIAAAALVVVVAAGVGVWLTIGREPAAPVASSGPVAAAPAGERLKEAPAVQPEDRVLGSPDAKVTVFEYASLTCPHCAHFEAEVLPQVKARYIDTGKVRLVFRDFPLDNAALRAAALARCMPTERYFGFIDVLFQSQGSWGTGPDPAKALVPLAKVAGMLEEEAQRCVTDEAGIDKVVAGRLDAERRFDIRSTPTFLIGGRRYAGALSLEEFGAIVDPLLAAAK